MPIASPVDASDDIADILVAYAAAEGSGCHPYIHSAELNAGADASRNLADVVHHLTLLHGRVPGLIETAGALNRDETLAGWYMSAAANFAGERAYLARLTVAVGTMPSTPGQAGCETAVIGQQRALDALAGSDRVGCALGATIALLLDWQSVRAALDTAADRLGVPVPGSLLPAEEEALAPVTGRPMTPTLERAILFGARQLCMHHHGLWNLLAARQQARAAAEA